MTVNLILRRYLVLPFLPIVVSHTHSSICSGTKVIVGTQIGVLSIFNRNSGWGDCVDRVPGYVCRLTIQMMTLEFGA
jgi:hypothetical protein